MPRQRQRIVYCDCFDCRDRPEELSLTPQQLDAATAVARQEPPPKALLLYATGFVCAAEGATNLEACTLPHCNLLVREGNLGLLSVRRAVEPAGSCLEPAVAEVAQLLGIHQDALRQPLSDIALAPLAEPDLPTLAARFKGMQAALGTTSAAVRQVTQRLGMAVVDRLCITGGGAATAEAAGAGGPGAGQKGTAAAEQRPLAGVLPDGNAFAAAAAAELGAAEGGTGRDLLLLHLDLDDLMAAAGAGAGAGTGVIETGLRAASASGVTTAAVPLGDGERATGSAAPGPGAATFEVEAEAEARWNAGCEALEWLDSLVRGLLSLPEIRERTLLVLMLSPAGRRMPVVPGQGAGPGGGLLQPGGSQIDPSATIVTPRSAALVGRGAGGAAAAVATAAAGGAAAGLALSVLDSEALPLISRPVQSFEMLGMAPVKVDFSAPVLVTRRLPGVVRRDRAERLGYREALSAGGQGAILIDRLMHEVAYKIGRAPKYGA